MTIKTLSISLISLTIILFGGWYIYDQTKVSHTPVVLSQSGSGLVSDLANPFSSGSSSGSVEELSSKTGNTLMNTRTTETPEMVYNTTWTPRTLSGVYYQFGVGNPKETDKSVEELMEMNKKCLENYVPESCDDRIISLQGEYIGVITNDDGTFKEFDRKPSRMTPEIEQRVLAFISNPLLRKSTELCGDMFWPDDMPGRVIYPQEDMSEVMSENWWKPYQIDINHLILINPSTGRKEFNIGPIWTLRTQILFPALRQGQTGNYTNTKLTDCLQKNNILAPLQAHVDRHYRELMWLWREYKVEG
jgi:hypothetical protein